MTAALAGFIVIALIMRQSYRLTVITDILEALLLASGAASFIPLILRTDGRIRAFWSLIVLGIVFWLTYQLFWVYYEVVLRQEVPDIFAGDVVLFLHIVPLMAAVAIRPHIPRQEQAAPLGRLDFALLLVWWIYLYVLLVIPWQYVKPDIPSYNRDLNAVYLVEKVAFLVGLVACFKTSRGAWRRAYASLFGMSLCYSASSTLCNWAIARDAYYSGSLYDIPLALAMTSVTWIGLSTTAYEPRPGSREVSTAYRVWVARCSMIAVFSLPAFGAWALSASDLPPRVRTFRLALTLGAALFMGGMVFVRQRLLDRELIHLLDESRQSFDNLKRLQAQILQSEKLASIGQLVGGAAHELNNPITAMLGYSDLLLGTTLSREQGPLAAKIGQYVRRTKSLVASLISFARQTPAPKAPLDLNTLARTAVKLTQPQWESLKIEVQQQFDKELPKVMGDSNQLLQVCLQLVGNCLYVMSERGGRGLIVSTTRQEQNSVLQITSFAMPLPASEADYADGLGLSACQGILQEHRGQIVRELRTDGSVMLRVELPATESLPARNREVRDAAAPVLWQSQPFA